ncbi:MAG: hypothetical protein AAGD13_06400 [Pseudomonadota bacterium]
MNENPKLLNQVRTQAQNRIGQKIYADAPESQKLLHQFGDQVAQLCGCERIHGSIKSRERAHQKLADRLGGDWFEMRDTVRMTIIAPDMTRLRKVQATIRARAVPHQKLGIIRDFELLPKQSPCGYSGVNFAIRLQNGQAGEIQLNIPEVMYGQFAPDLFVSIVGQEASEKIRAAKGLDGGLGHAFYEIYRTGKSTPAGKQAADLSTRYFECLRSHSGAKAQTELVNAIAAFRSEHPKVFAH